MPDHVSHEFRIGDFRIADSDAPNPIIIFEGMTPTTFVLRNQRRGVSMDRLKRLATYHESRALSLAKDRKLNGFTYDQ